MRFPGVIHPYQFLVQPVSLIVYMLTSTGRHLTVPEFAFPSPVMVSIFACAYLLCVSSCVCIIFAEVDVPVICLCYIWFSYLLSFESSLFILNITSFLDMPFANTFFHVLPCVFILSPVPFEEKSTKSYSLLFVFFYGSGTAVASKNLAYFPKSRRACSMFFDGSFTVLSFTFRSMIYF